MQPEKSSMLNGDSAQKCLICNKQPLPQSAQRTSFIILQLILLFFNFRLSLIVAAIGYYFSEIVWKCPVCKREIDLRHPDKSVEENVILRFGNCIGMITKEKYMVIAAIFCGVMALSIGYGWYIQPPPQVAKTDVQPLWANLVRDCGKSVMMDNEVAAHNHFRLYKQFNWELKGVWVSVRKDTPTGPVWNVKMSPTQFSNTTEHDIIMHTYRSGIGQYGGEWEKGQWFAFSGEFALLDNEGLHFIVNTITKLPKKQASLEAIPGMLDKPSNLRITKPETKPQTKPETKPSTHQ